MNDDASVSVADPGFFNGGVNSQRGYINILFYKIFAENGVKTKEFRPKGGGGLCVSPAVPLDPPLSLIKMKNYLPPCVFLVLHFIFCPQKDISTGDSHKIWSVSEIWTIIDMDFVHRFLIRSDCAKKCKLE